MKTNGVYARQTRHVLELDSRGSLNVRAIVSMLGKPVMFWSGHSFIFFQNLLANRNGSGDN